MTIFRNLLAGNVHLMRTEETSLPRMLVLNHTTREAWVNVTLACNSCGACQRRKALAGDRELIEVRNGVLDGHLWCAVPYPESGKAKDAQEVIFTPRHIESTPRGVLQDARCEDKTLVWDTDD